MAPPGYEASAEDLAKKAAKRSAREAAGEKVGNAEGGPTGLGLVPEAEVLDALRDAVFAPLASETLYDPLTVADLAAPEDDYHRHTPSFSSEAARDVSADVWAEAKRVRQAAPAGATSEIRIHTVTCDEHGCDEEASRYGVLVKIEVAPGLTLHREYSVE